LLLLLLLLGVCCEAGRSQQQPRCFTVKVDVLFLLE
jgi:hypothetical protein